MYLYRYQEHTNVAIHDKGRLNFPCVELKLITFYIVKETPCGFWFTTVYNEIIPTKDRWVSKTSRKRYAYLTKKEAFHAYQKRKQAQIQILKDKLELAKIAAQLTIELE